MFSISNTKILLFGKNFPKSSLKMCYQSKRFYYFYQFVRSLNINKFIKDLTDESRGMFSDKNFNKFSQLLLILY